jgi:hypothetical protein
MFPICSKKSSTKPKWHYIAGIASWLEEAEKARLSDFGEERSIRSKGLKLMTVHHYHAVVWIDHHEARVFHFSPTDVATLVLHPDRPTRHIHHKANAIGSGNATEDHAFLHAVTQSIADAGAVLITGPASAKNELVKHIDQHDHTLMKIIAGVETVDHPSDAQLVAHARHYFKAEDLMEPQKVRS